MSTFNVIFYSLCSFVIIGTIVVLYRNSVVYKARIAAIDLRRKVVEKIDAEAVQGESFNEELWHKARNVHNQMYEEFDRITYNSMMFDLTTWTKRGFMRQFPLVRKCLDETER